MNEELQSRDFKILIHENVGDSTWGLSLKDATNIEFSSEIYSSNVFIDQERVVVNLDGAYRLEELACTRKGWSKWHINRFYGISLCGRTVHGSDAYVINKHSITEEEMCKTCFKHEHR